MSEIAEAVYYFRVAASVYLLVIAALIEWSV